MPDTTATKYRWECSEHKQHGRWLSDPNAAGQHGYNHWDRSGSQHESGTCRPRLADDHGNDCGAAV